MKFLLSAAIASVFILNVSCKPRDYNDNGETKTVTEAGTDKMLVTVGALKLSNYAKDSDSDNVFLCAYELDAKVSDDDSIPPLSEKSYVTHDPITVRALKDIQSTKKKFGTIAATTAVAGLGCLVFAPCAAIAATGALFATAMGIGGAVATGVSYSITKERLDADEAYKLAFVNGKNTTMSSNDYNKVKAALGTSNTRTMTCNPIKASELRSALKN